jgi:hypothetical protein
MLGCEKEAALRPDSIAGGLAVHRHQVLKERELGNVLEFPAVAEAIPVAKAKKRRHG